jgi:major membrane immunogen (membrane-anchored lipoprotein)
MKKVYLLVLVFASVLMTSCGSNNDVEDAELTHGFQLQANDKDTVGSAGNGNGGGGSQDEGDGPDGW